MYKTFIQSFTFNFSAAFLYKISLLSHQILLYTIIDKNLYGHQNSLFAALYTLIALTNFGFDETLLPFFSMYSQSQKQCKQVLIYGYIHVITIMAIAAALYCFAIYSSEEFLHILYHDCNKNMTFVFIGLFFFESLKKSLIIIMQLAFLYKKIAYMQTLSLFVYIGSIWFFYATCGYISLIALFAPMFITSSCEVLYMLYECVQFYQQLPEEPKIANIPFKVLFLQRFYNYINQIVKFMYSSNSMTLYFAYTIGFAQAATIKFFTNIITLLYTCIAKSIGATSTAIFAASKEENISQTFKDVTYRYFQLIMIISAVLLTIISYAYHTAMITPIMVYYILLFFLITSLEHIAITYEQMMIIQGQSSRLAIINSIALTLVASTAYIYWYTHFQIVMYVYIVCKSISILMITQTFFPTFLLLQKNQK
jgi:hypothetical protein